MYLWFIVLKIGSVLLNALSRRKLLGARNMYAPKVIDLTVFEERHPPRLTQILAPFVFCFIFLCVVALRGAVCVHCLQPLCCALRYYVIVLNTISLWRDKLHLTVNYKLFALLLGLR